MDERITRERINKISESFSVDGFLTNFEINELIAHAEATIPKEKPAGREYCQRLGCSNLAAPNAGFCLNHTTYYAHEKC